MRVWFLTHRLPYAPNRGDRIRAYHILKYLRSRAEVDLFSLVHDDAERAQAGSLRELAASVTTADVPLWSNRVKAVLTLPSSRPLTLSLLDSPSLRQALTACWNSSRPDVVLAYCSGMAQYALMEPLSDVPWLLDMVDVDSEKWRALGTTGRWPQKLIYRREGHCLRRFERQAMKRAAVTSAVSDREVETLRQIDGSAAVLKVANGIALDSFSPKDAPAASASVVFCGVMDYAPNEEAALRLVQDIWPSVKRQRPDARLLLVGMNPTPRLTSAAAGDPTIDVTGAVPDVRPYLWRSAVAAVPLNVARGVQNKVLEALAAGLPAVVSPVVADGLPAVALPGTTVATADDEFTAAILTLLSRSTEERRRIATACDLASLSWERQLEPLWNALQEVAGRGVR